MRVRIIEPTKILEQKKKRDVLMQEYQLQVKAKANHSKIKQPITNN